MTSTERMYLVNRAGAGKTPRMERTHKDEH
jgi:hypothetical protein